MGKESDLLRMLEPAIRPVTMPPGASHGRALRLPFEQSDFESLLGESLGSGGTLPVQAEASSQVGEDIQTEAVREPLGPLDTFDRIENVSLRHLIDMQSRSMSMRPDPGVQDDQNTDVQV